MIKIIEADYKDSKHNKDIMEVLNSYSLDPMGQGEELSDEVKTTLPAQLARFPGSFSLLAYDEYDNAVGLANCFMGFSTFKAKPLVNIHDIAVLPEARGRGIGKMLIDAVKNLATKKYCCKVTLEVRADNPAEKLYRREGFKDGESEMKYLSCDLS